MAKWLYLYKTTGTSEGDVNVSAPVTAFPIYDTQTKSYVLTEQAKGTSLRYRCYNDGKVWVHKGVGVSCYFSSLGRSVTVFESIYHENVTTYTGSTNTVLPNKLFRVETDEDLSSHGTVYPEKTVSGRYRIKTTAATMPNGCLVPVNFSVGGVVYHERAGLVPVSSLSRRTGGRTLSINPRFQQKQEITRILGSACL